ncbi:hypothetical protein CW304_31845 [Bacillus sp. UFRGS-B20]|nr:hypothetical protein CW304_31845 [Bacillus sp. UFRGS-B20]
MQGYKPVHLGYGKLYIAGEGLCRRIFRKTGVNRLNGLLQILMENQGSACYRTGDLVEMAVSDGCVRVH